MKQPSIASGERSIVRAWSCVSPYQWDCGECVGLLTGCSIRRCGGVQAAGRAVKLVRSFSFALTVALVLALTPRSPSRKNPRDACRHILRGRLAARELLPQIRHQLGDLGVVETVAISRHRTEFGPRRRVDAVENHADQVIGRRAMQVRVERKRRMRAQQLRPAAACDDDIEAQAH